MKNMLANARPRYFIRSDGSVNKEEFADTNTELITVDGNLGQDSILPVQPNTLNNIYVEVLNNKIDELKETTGNRDISTGGTTSGVTAASAIAAMQEAGSKLSRDNNKASYRAFRKLCLMIIELIRQFYDLPRCFRIMGENGAARFVQYSNAGISPQMQDSFSILMQVYHHKCKALRWALTWDTDFHCLISKSQLKSNHLTARCLKMNLLFNSFKQASSILKLQTKLLLVLT